MKIALALGCVSGLVSLAACTSDAVGKFSQALSAPPPGQCGQVETHVIGMYQATNGEATVTIQRPGKHVLVLSAHEATTWHVKTAPGAILEHVYAVGVRAQTVDLGTSNGHPDVLIDSKDTDGTSACGYSWPYAGDGCNTDHLLELVAVRTHHDVNSFVGCHQASTWTIGGDMAAQSDCAIIDHAEQDHFFSCDPADTDGHCGGGSGGPDAGIDAPTGTGLY